MQGSVEQRLNGPGQEFESEAQISRDLYTHLKVTGHLQEDGAGFQDSDDEEEEEKFSFDCGEPSTSPIAAEDAFADGKIKPVFPLFGRDSPFSSEGSAGLPLHPPVRKIFVEADGGGGVGPSGPGNDEIVGPVCEWSSRKAVEASPAAAEGQVCKKSNSTGFSKIWRFKELVGIRSNSDGRDAFVFLNGGGAVPAEERADPPPAGVKTRKEGKKGGKGAKKTASSAAAAAHEVYLRSKAKEEERRRSYLPYRPELVGFFTNVNGGLTKNVHPF